MVPLWLGQSPRWCAVRRVARGVQFVARGARCVVLVWFISAVVLVSLDRWALSQFRMQFPCNYFKT